MNKGKELFEDLFVLELANNHWGDISRGKKIIEEYGKLCKKHNIKAAMKFQFRDPEGFIHKDFLETAVDDEAANAPGSNSRYIKKTLATALTKEQFKELVDFSKKWGFLTMTTAYDEITASWAKDLDIDMLKIASHFSIAWPLIETIAKLGKPTIISNGGTKVEDLDRVIVHFEKLDIPLAINHCVSVYPSEDFHNELHQVEFLRKRYPRHVIGFSAHDYNNIDVSHFISYARGARTFERHIDIDDGKRTVSTYCILPEKAELWFKAHNKVKEMLGPETMVQRKFSDKEKLYVKSVSRGAYSKRDLSKGFVIGRNSLNKDFYLAIPLQEGQLSERDLENEITLKKDTKKDKPIHF